MTTRPSVLFICTHNAGRSQLGAHLLELLAPGQFTVLSAGTKPSDAIGPVVAEALAELGIDTSAAVPSAVTADELASVDIVVTMKHGLALPGPISGQHVEWAFADPADWELDGVRELRGRIQDAIAAAIPEWAAVSID